MLKTSVQAQLDGVRTGLNQLSNALKDLKGIKDRLATICKKIPSTSSLVKMNIFKIKNKCDTSLFLLSDRTVIPKALSCG